MQWRLAAKFYLRVKSADLASFTVDSVVSTVGRRIKTDYSNEEISPVMRALVRRMARRTFATDPFRQMHAILGRALKHLDELRSWIETHAWIEAQRALQLKKDVRALKRRQRRLGYCNIPRKLPTSPSGSERMRLR
jgi:hypothetical protein